MYLFQRNCVKSSPLHLHPYRPRRTPLPTHLPSVKKFPVTARFASRSLRRKQMRLSGAVPRVGITCTRTASSSGQGAKRGKRFDVCIGETVLEAAERTDLTDTFQPYAMAKRRGIAQASQESRESEWRGICECGWRAGLIRSTRLLNLSPALGTTSGTRLLLMIV